MYLDAYKGEKHRQSKKLDGHRPEYDADNREHEIESKYKNFKGEPID